MIQKPNSAKIIGLKTNLFRKNKKNLETKKVLQTQHGEVQHGFYAPEFLEYPRGPVWYLIAGLISIGILSFSILARNITLTLAFLFFVAVYWLIHHRQARMIEIKITKNGLDYDEEFFSFGEIKEFWVIYNLPFVADLKIHLKRKLHPIVTIHIFGQDPFVLRQLLSPHVKEIERDEAFVDLLVRALRL